MSSKPIIIVCGEPQSVFFEIFLKTIKKLNPAEAFKIFETVSREIDQFN